MNNFFRRLPLFIKLMLIGLIPLAFLIYLTIQLYREKTQKVNLLGSYIQRIHQSVNISTLIDHLQIERWYSYMHALKKDQYKSVLLHRPRTDSSIKRLQAGKDEALTDFTKYTFLEDLPKVRRQVDSGKISANQVMHFYTTIIYRVNTLNAISPGSEIYLQPVYKDLIAQKLLSEMATSLGIIRSNIYNVLFTKQFMVETLIGLIGVHDVYNTYETEFLIKASAPAIEGYKKVRNSTALKPTVDYLDTLFKRFSFDSTYDAETWWTISSNGVDELRNFQQTLLGNVQEKLNSIYENELAEKNRTLVFLILALLIIVFIVVYTIQVITLMLLELKQAAQKISTGATGLHFNIKSNDAIGSLAQSILKIDKNNKQLADAAYAIGKGDFEVPVNPRGRDDLLGNAIVDMKYELQQFNRKQKLKQQEITKAVLNAQEKERIRIGEELHDNINQILSTVKLYLDVLSEDDQQRDELIPKSIRNLSLAIEEIRKLSKTLVVPGLRGETLTQSIQDLIHDILLASPVSITFNVKDLKEEVLSEEYKIAIYRIIQEQLNNILKYAQASSINISLDKKDGQVELLIEDNGIGFDVTARRRGVGITNIINRAELLNGKVEIESSPGQGCRMRVVLDAKGIVTKEADQ